MDWVPKIPLQWDWETLELFNGKESEISKPAQVPDLRVEGGAGIWNGSVCSSGGGASSILELGNHSSRSSVSTSFDSSPEAGKRKSQFYFDSVQGTHDNLNIFTRADDTGTSPLPLAASCSKEPLTGLKLGQTYFEDVGAGNNIKNSSSLASMTSSTAVEKKARVSQQNIQNPYCQVEGCNVDLTTSKDYHRKHRVCENHSKTPKVIVAGQERRFCQQCSRFHDLSEFDQKKRSCRRRLSDHNARRRKPQPTTISFNSSRLSSSYYENRRQMNLVFGQGPLDHVTTAISSTWDDSGNFKLVHPKDSWTKSNKAGDVSGEQQFSSIRQLHNISTRCHDWDGIFPSKGTTAEVLNQDVEACAFASNLDGAPDLRRALSLLSNDTWSPTKPGGSSNFKSANTKSIYAAHPVINTVDSTVGFLQNGQPLAQPTMLPFNLQNDNAQFQEFQLFKSPFQTSFFDATRIH